MVLIFDFSAFITLMSGFHDKSNTMYQREGLSCLRGLFEDWCVWYFNFIKICPGLGGKTKLIKIKIAVY